MHILVLSWRGPGHPLAGGAEISTLEHAKGWVKGGHQVTWFTSIFPSCQQQETINGVQIIRRGVDIFGVHLEAFRWYVFGSHPRFDLVVDQFHGIPFFTPLYVKAKKLAFIHEVAKEVWRLNPWPKPFNLIPAVIGQIGEPLIFRLLYTQIPFMTVSESTRADLMDFGVKNVTVIHNGVTLPRKMPKNGKEKVFTVIYLSALAKDKGIEDAIEAFGLLHRRFPSSKFWVVGKGDKDYVHYLKSRCQVGKFWGFVSESRKFELLARAQVLLNPSVHEGWGLVNIEANSVGTPVVGYNVAGIKDSVIDGKTGILVGEKKVGGLVTALEKIKTGTHWESGCKWWARNFTWYKSVQESLKLITKL